MIKRKRQKKLNKKKTKYQKRKRKRRQKGKGFFSSLKDSIVEVANGMHKAYRLY